MDKISLAGLVIALVAIIGGQVLEGGQVSSLVQPSALLIVLGGTLGAVLLQSPLHVFRRGIRPEWCGLNDNAQELIAIDVKVASEDICFAGLPGNDAKLRVRKLEVLT